MVDEGVATTNHDVAVRGIESLPLEDQKRVTAAATKALPRGERFDEAAFKGADDAVKAALTEHGYAYANVTSEGQVDAAAHSADYVITIKPGPLAMFGAISVVGLDPDGAGPRQPEYPRARSAARWTWTRGGSIPRRGSRPPRKRSSTWASSARSS